MNEATIWESFCEYLRMRGYDIPVPERVNESGLMFESSPVIQDTLVHIMKHDPESALLSELLVDFDEGLLEWRYRHVKMVERTIGTKKGTGGSDGVQYLKKTLEYKAFPDLWEIRTRF
jgi:tryptophan 2,3-dioxygenase